MSNLCPTCKQPVEEKKPEKKTEPKFRVGDFVEILPERTQDKAACGTVTYVSNLDDKIYTDLEGFKTHPFLPSEIRMISAKVGK